MTRLQLSLRALVVLAAAVFVAGCGGGDDGMVDAAPSPTPAPDPGAQTVGDGGVQPDGGVDPITGEPIDAGEIGGTDISATIPKLDGSDVSGGLAAVGATPLFAPGALDPGKFAETEQADKTDKVDDLVSDQVEETKPKVRFAGARMYVNGVTHEVKLNGTFPKSDPVFRLVGVTASTVEIELIAGEFSTNGGTGVFLDKGELVSVLNQSEQLDYRVKYLRPVTSSDDGFGFN